MNSADMHDLMSGRTRGAGASFSRFWLRSASWLYRAGLALRNTLYGMRLLPAYRPKVPVVSVGNITAGGTGKTPLVEWVLRALPEKLRNTAVVLSRGYGGSGEKNDETDQLVENLPGIWQIVGADRVANAKNAESRFNAGAIVLDDGFQHRRLKRDLDIVTIDALVPFGYGYLVPRGLLREPLSALRRAGAFVVTRSDQVDPPVLEKIENVLRKRNPHALLARSCHAPSKLLVDGEEKGHGWLKGKKIFAFCGIGNPEGFRRTLQSLETEIAAFEALGDHEAYPPPESERLAASAAGSGADLIVTTQKDAVKVRGFEWPLPFAELRVAMEMTKGGEELRGLLLETCGVSDGFTESPGISAEASAS